MSARLFHFAQVSLEAFDQNPEVAADVEAALETQPDAVSFSEATVKGHRDEVTEVCKSHDYAVRGGLKGDTCVALRGDHDVMRFESVVAHGGGSDEFGAYGPRTLEVLTARIESEVVTVIGGHWLRPKNVERRAKHAVMTRTAVDQMSIHSGGTRLAVLLGDLNERDTVVERLGTAGARFNAAGITTIWDELGVYPATGPHGGTIDFLATKDEDRRMQAAGVHVWRLGNSDHHRVSGFYSVRSLA